MSDLEKIFEYYNVEYGNEKRMCCPFDDHPDNHPSFSADFEKDVWFCFGCRRKGNALTFISQWEDISNAEARLRATQILGRKLMDLPQSDERGVSYLPSWTRNR